MCQRLTSETASSLMCFRNAHCCIIMSIIGERSWRSELGQECIQIATTTASSLRKNKPSFASFTFLVQPSDDAF